MIYNYIPFPEMAVYSDRFRPVLFVFRGFAGRTSLCPYGAGIGGTLPMGEVMWT